MAPTQSKKYAVASEKSSGPANLNLNVASLGNSPMLQASAHHHAQQAHHLANARNAFKNSTRHSHSQQQPLHNLPHAVAPTKAPDPAPGPGPVPGPGSGVGSAQIHGAGDAKLHALLPASTFSFLLSAFRFSHHVNHLS
ncbi:uncharacterized protein Z520_09310 [Fonsecaea multimorphosa CBS 102226]|uniref:Uncharacterized protein n=1 Tax=Fonsecaea multimorphosa CBS 102226 TaxID=1442371 RepID=A0A0D2GZN6_9EURO|nr:uncharacterized protein Z520_09310 [Fonsecaea multimorphosa CBS 102226]KIX95000.1 hypothetical protein Z520_09310 [Fonsecaea multimorphosa CBS 102226]